MIDKIADKIDYMFRRSKNADERCFDFFLRTITFFIILLLVLFFGNFANASSTISNGSAEFTTISSISKLGDTTGWNYSLSNINTSFYSVYGSSSYFPLAANTKIFPSDVIYNYVTYPYMTNEFYKNLYYPTSASCTLYGDTFNYDPNSYYVVLCHEMTNGNGSRLPQSDNFRYTIVFIPTDCYLSVGGSNTNNSAFIYSFNGSYPKIFYLYMEVNPTTNEYTGSFGSAQGNNVIGTVGVNRIFYSDMPIYYSNGVTITSNSMSTNVLSNNESGYLADLNMPLQEDLLVEPDPIESNENHLFLNDIQVGLTSNSVGQDILSSSVVIGVDPDDWIVNNPDDFQLGVTYTLHFKDNMDTNPNDPTKAFGVMLPIKTFFKQNYSYGIAEIFRNMDMLSYYNNLNEGGVKIITDFTYKALLPSPLKAFEQTLGQFICDQLGATEEILTPYTVFDATLTVDCVLVDTVSGEMSHRYIKEFDFIHGSESVKNADILKNYNPWEGEPNSQQSPIVPSAPNSVGGYSGGNTNVSVNVSGQKVPIGVKTKAEIETILNNYKEVNDNFMDYWEDLSDPVNDNNFMHFLGQSVQSMPAVDYLIKGACVIFGISIILFVLKVLLF